VREGIGIGVLALSPEPSISWLMLNSASASGGGGHPWSQPYTPPKVMSVCVSALQSKGFGVLEAKPNGSKGRGLAGK
jgi:hypothetical protein